MVRRPDFRLTVWLVAYVSLTVSSMVLEDFSTPLEMTGVGDVRRSDSRHQEGGVLCTTKTRIRDPCQSVLRASQNQASTLSIQESPAAALNLSSGNAGSCCMWMVSVLLRWVIIFFTNLQNPFRFPGAGEREGKIGSLYTGILDSFLSKLHSGRNDRDIHDRGE